MNTSSIPSQGICRKCPAGLYISTIKIYRAAESCGLGSGRKHDRTTSEQYADRERHSTIPDPVLCRDRNRRPCHGDPDQGCRVLKENRARRWILAAPDRMPDAMASLGFAESPPCEPEQTPARQKLTIIRLAYRPTRLGTCLLLDGIPPPRRTTMWQAFARPNVRFLSRR